MDDAMRASCSSLVGAGFDVQTDPGLDDILGGRETFPFGKQHKEANEPPSMYSMQ